MLATFEGEPESALKSFDQDEKHAISLMTGSISEKEVLAIAEWIAGSKFPEPEEPEPVVVAGPAPPAPTPAVVIAASPVAVIAAKPAAAGKVTAIAIEPGKKTDRLMINLAGKQPDGLDIRNADGTLVIRLPNVVREGNVPESLSGKNTRAIGTVTSSDENGTLVISVASRDGDLKYTAIQSRNRLSLELAATPAKKVAAAPVAKVATPAKPVAKAAKPAAAVTTATSKAATGTTTTDVGVAALAAGTAAAVAKSATPPTQKSASESKKPEPVAKAPAGDATAKAKQEADAKASKEAETLAAKKREQEALAAQQKSASDAAKKEAELLASLKVSAESLQAGMSGMSGASGGRKDRSKLKAPAKFRDEPCPPIENSEPIGNVDVSKAKEIIERVGCPQCHAFVAKKTGPPFKKVFEKVKGNPSCVIQKLKKNKEHNEEGVTDDLKGPEFKIVADYISTRAK